MEPAKTLTVIDSDVFIRDLRYTRDKEFKTNQHFLESIAKTGNGATTLVNLLEVCGILSYNLEFSQLKELFFYFPHRYQLQVLPVHSLQGPLPEVGISDLFSFIENKLSLGDALVAEFMHQYIPGAEVFVSWNARHFQNLHLPAITPAEYLRQAR